MSNKFISSSLKHYGVKGMRWGVVKKEDLLDKSKLPYPLADDLPKTKPRPSSSNVPGALSKRLETEIQDNIKNRIKDFDKVPRFNPKNESIDTAVQKINEGYAFGGNMTIDMAKKYDLINDNGTIRNFGNNCTSTSMAYELRRRGFDVEAGLNTPADIHRIRRAFNISEAEIKEEQALNVVPPHTFEEFEKYLKSMGPGARGFCLMNWNDMNASHICSFEIDDKGNIIYIDAQTGKTSKNTPMNDPMNPANYYKRSSKYFAIRIDNRKMNPDQIKNLVRIDDRIDPIEAKKSEIREIESTKIKEYIDKYRMKDVQEMLPTKKRRG